MQPTEITLAGLPGPTHHYGGLGIGNVASQTHAGWTSRPRLAARQCLAAMRAAAEAGQPVWMLPPLPRPDLAFLRAAGLADAADAAAREPGLLSVAASSAAMWTANAATVVPACDSGDGRAHVLPANLVSTAHRSLEAAGRTAMLRRFFAATPDLVVHDPLPASTALADEGAANHSRLVDAAGVVHLLVHGVPTAADGGPPPAVHPPRQTRAAQAALARLAALPAERCCFVRQHPDAIDAGAFHNDVVMVGQGRHLLIHERAWLAQAERLAELRQRLPGLVVHEVAEADLALDEAIACYLFNSQLIPTAGAPVLLAPIECRAARPAAVVDRLREEGFVADVQHVDLRQSMQGGGGPACLRLRVPLDEAQLAGLPASLRWTPANEARWLAIIDAVYPEELRLDDLAGVAVDAVADRFWNAA